MEVSGASDSGSIPDRVAKQIENQELTSLLYKKIAFLKAIIHLISQTF